MNNKIITYDIRLVTYEYQYEYDIHIISAVIYIL